MINNKTYIFLILLIIIGILSCLICVRKISSIDPSEAYGNRNISSSPFVIKDSKFLKHKLFLKIAITKTFKNTRRLIFTALSISFCIILTFISVACLQSKNSADNNSFGKRLNYDFITYVDNIDTISTINNISEVDFTENNIVFTDTIYSNNNNFEGQINSLINNNKMLVPYDKNNYRLDPADGIILEEYVANLLNVDVGDYVVLKEKNLKVTGIAREYFNYSAYISDTTAKNLGFNNVNTVSVKLHDWADIKDTANSIMNLDEVPYIKILNEQKATHYDVQSALDIVFYLFIFISLLVGVIIIFNMIVIVVNERRLEYATLYALGTPTKNFWGITAYENVQQYIFAVIFAVVPSYFLASLILESMSGVQQNFPLINPLIVYIITLLISLFYVFMGSIYTLYTINRINPAIELNARG